MKFRVERTDYLEIEVDAAALIKEYADKFSEYECENEEFVKEVLYKFEFADLSYSGNWIEVINHDCDYLIEEVNAK